MSENEARAAEMCLQESARNRRLQSDLDALAAKNAALAERVRKLTNCADALRARLANRAGRCGCFWVDGLPSQRVPRCPMCNKDLEALRESGRLIASELAASKRQEAETAERIVVNSVEREIANYEDKEGV